jgi:hypothetical protein
MRKLSILCDVCGNTVDKFNGAVTLASWGSIHKDACSPKCLAALLLGFAADIEKKEGMKAADNIAFAAQHPEATMLGQVPAPGLAPPVPVLPVGTKTETPEPTIAGCAACNAGIPVNADNAFKHTGEGKLCKAVRGPGPCACPPSSWRMTPSDSSTPGSREVTCDKCGNVWESMLRSPEKEAAAAAPAPGAKRRGRPPKQKPEASTTNGTSSLDVETPENKAERDRKLGRTFADQDEMSRINAKQLRAEHQDQDTTALRTQAAAAKSNFTYGGYPSVPIGDQQPPRWCKCGKPLLFVNEKWTCEEHGIATDFLEVKYGHPGENLSQLLSDVYNLGVELNLVDVAGWSVIKRDMLRMWVEQGGDRPTFLDPEPAPNPEPEPEPAAQPKYTF